MKFLILCTIISLFSIFNQPAFAYLDGATISSVIQILGAFFIGGLVAFRSSYSLIKSKIKAFSVKFKK
mgnify:CR=1 FL=1|tara:strand:- start:2305 stop:2508 length:204 start_codon:yes stop_codon:yes gene_type:complete